MKRWREHFQAWLPGTALALAGVVCVRLLAPHLTGRPQAVAAVAGYLLVPVGFFLIARQIGRRAAARAAAAPAPGERTS